MTTKICSKCKAEKELDQFHKQPTGKLGRHSWCKVCFNQYHKEYSTKYSPEQKAKWNLSTRYKLNHNDIREMLIKQGGKCAICKKPLVKFCVDHDHSTGKVRGILCHRCNILIGGWDDSEWKKKALEYINANTY